MLEKAWPLLTALAGLLVGAFLGTSLQQRERARPDSGECADQAQQQPCRLTLDDEQFNALARELARPTGRLALDAQERKAIADEVVRALKSDEPARHEARPSPPPPLPASVAIHAKEEAGRLLEHAQSSREWTDRDAQALRLWLPMLSAADRAVVMHTLGTAFNEGRVALRAEGPAF
jgi:hypothetical protein